MARFLITPALTVLDGTASRAGMTFRLQRINHMVFLYCYVYSNGSFTKENFDTNEQIIPEGFVPISSYFDIPLYDNGRFVGTIRYNKNGEKLWSLSENASRVWCTGYYIYEI